MKLALTLLVVGLCAAGLSSAPAQTLAAAYSVIERGPHHRVLESPGAQPGAPPHRIVELATGLHYWSEAEQAWKSAVLATRS